MTEISVDEDTYSIIQLTKNTLGVSDEKAICYLLEIGLVNIINYPVENPLLNRIMENGNFPVLMNRIKLIWGK